jgi:spermidine synthase
MTSPQLEILAYEETRLGLLCLRRRRLLSRRSVVVTEVTLNHEFLMSSYLTTSERSLARRAIEIHGGRALNVLLGGLGLGYTAHEALLSTEVVRLDVVEYLPQVIGWMDQNLIPLAEELKADSRLTVIEGDVYAMLAQPPQRTYDLILIDVDHSPAEHLGTANARFYTAPGLGLARRHLAPSGVLGVWSYAEHSPFVEALRSTFGEVQVEPITVHNDLVDEEQTDWLFFAHG